MYIKIKNGNNIVSVEELKHPVFVNYQAKHDLLLTCESDKAQGIIGQDCDTVYQLYGRRAIPRDGLLTAEYITEAEYNFLYDELNIVPAEPEAEQPPEESEHIYTAAELRGRVLLLEEQISELQEQNEFLEECLLEMSEAVYA